MLDKHSAAFAVISISVIVAFSVFEVDAQATVDDSASCESSSLDDAVDLIREDLKDVKNLLGSSQQQCSPTECSSSKEALVSSVICEYKPHLIRFRTSIIILQHRSLDVCAKTLSFAADRF